MHFSRVTETHRHTQSITQTHTPWPKKKRWNGQGDKEVIVTTQAIAHLPLRDENTSLQQTQFLKASPTSQAPFPSQLSGLKSLQVCPQITASRNTWAPPSGCPSTPPSPPIPAAPLTQLCPPRHLCQLSRLGCWARVGSPGHLLVGRAGTRLPTGHREPPSSQGQ